MSNKFKKKYLGEFENPKKTGFFNQCKNKIKYETKKKAFVVLYEIYKKDNLENNTCIYKCPYCEHWHIGRSNT